MHKKAEAEQYSFDITETFVWADNNTITLDSGSAPDRKFHVYLAKEYKIYDYLYLPFVHFIIL